MSEKQLKAMCEAAANAASACLMATGQAMPMALFDTEQGTIMLPLTFEDPREKGLLRTVLQELIRTIQPRYVVIVVEAWYAHKGKDEPVPSSLENEPGREECVSVVGSDGVITMAGERMFSRDAAGNPVLSDTLHIETMEPGSFKCNWLPTEWYAR